MKNVKLKKLPKLPQITGDVPYIYSRMTIYTLGIAINVLVDRVNYLEEVIWEMNEVYDEEP